MNCAEVRAKLEAYVDGELPVGETTAIDAHCGACELCEWLARREREFRRTLRRQPREAAPPELRDRIVRDIRRESRMRTARWTLVPAAAVAAVIVLAVLLPWSRQAPPLVVDLVDKHIAYSQVDRPAELTTSDPREVATWFVTRAGMRVTVPDYSPAGIRLVGARLADAHERKAAYLLYEKGRTLLSVFIVPVSAADAEVPGRTVSFRGYEYRAYEQKGFRTVSWADGHVLYGLVSMLDYEALLECADRLRVERMQQTKI
jgi:anti-sigma factor (TIGR02949 family)